LADRLSCLRALFRRPWVRSGFGGGVLGVGLSVLPVFASISAPSPKTRFFPCRVVLIPGAVSGAEGGGSGFFIRKEDVFKELGQGLEDALGAKPQVLNLPPDLGVASRGLFLRESYRRRRQTSGQENSHHSEVRKDSALAPTAERPEIWVAHSQAGLDARYALAEDPSLRQGVRGLITLATPHQGTPVSDRLLRGGVWMEFVSWGLRTFFDYDLRQLDFLRDVSSAVLSRSEVQKRLYRPSSGDLQSHAEGPRVFSVTFSCRAGRCSWPFRVLEFVSGVTEVTGTRGDGLVPRESQAFGESLGHFELDHLEQVGGALDASGVIERRRFHDALVGRLKEICLQSSVLGSS
jgi:hypothetical protein